MSQSCCSSWSRTFPHLCPFPGCPLCQRDVLPAPAPPEAPSGSWRRKAESQPLLWLTMTPTGGGWGGSKPWCWSAWDSSPRGSFCGLQNLFVKGSWSIMLQSCWRIIFFSFKCVQEKEQKCSKCTCKTSLQLKYPTNIFWRKMCLKVAALYEYHHQIEAQFFITKSGIEIYHCSFIFVYIVYVLHLTDLHTCVRIVQFCFILSFQNIRSIQWNLPGPCRQPVLIVSVDWSPNHRLHRGLCPKVSQARATGGNRFN